jgi:hypothetical protein
MGEWRCSFTILKFVTGWEESVQLHPPAALLAGMEPPILIG